MKKVITYSAYTIILSCFSAVLFAQITPKGINQILVDQKNWQLKQLPEKSVQRQMEWSKIPYEAKWSTRKETFNPIGLPQYQQQSNPFEAAFNNKDEKYFPFTADQQKHRFKLDRFYKRTVGIGPDYSINLLQ